MSNAISKMDGHLLAESRKQRLRAEKAEAERDEMQAQRDDHWSDLQAMRGKYVALVATCEKADAQTDRQYLELETKYDERRET